MPIAPTGGKVLVTGANGFVAVWVVRYLLGKGYSVRGSVRSAAKGEELQKHFSSYGDKFEFVVVNDFLKDGAFDEAVKGVDVIEHTASPVTMSADDPQEVIGPAVRGTVNVLESARKFGSNVKRIVVTSSTAAVFRTPNGPTVYNETNWNDLAVELVEKDGRQAANYYKYQASKVLAERAAWDFAAQHKGTIGWDVVVLNPSMVFGPVAHYLASPAALTWSGTEFYQSVIKCEMTDEELATIGTEFIDVRDLADAHVLALEREEAGGERIIISSEPYKWQDWLDAANEITPPIPGLRKGQPGSAKDANHNNRYDTAKMKRILGIEARKVPQTARDTLLDYRTKGWLSA